MGSGRLVDEVSESERAPHADRKCEAESETLPPRSTLHVRLLRHNSEDVANEIGCRGLHSRIRTAKTTFRRNVTQMRLAQTGHLNDYPAYTATLSRPTVPHGTGKDAASCSCIIGSNISPLLLPPSSFSRFTCELTRCARVSRASWPTMNISALEGRTEHTTTATSAERRTAKMQNRTTTSRRHRGERRDAVAGAIPACALSSGS